MSRSNMNKNIKDNLSKAKQVMVGTKKAKLITFGAASLSGIATIAIPVAVVSTSGQGSHDSTSSMGAKPHQDIDEPTFLIKYPGSIVNHEIVADAFKDATLPSDFALPSTITNIGENAFSGASLPSSFSLPSSIASIDATAFDGAAIPAGCHWEKDGQIVSAVTDGGHEYKVVKNITEDEFLAIYPGSIVNHGIVAFAFKDATIPSNFALPDTIKVIGSSAFAYTTLPAGFTLPASLSQVEKSAFMQVTLPVSFNLPVSVSVSYGPLVFAGSHFLGKITVYNQTLSENMFLSADLSAGITISDSVTHLDKGVFEGGSKLPEDFTLPDSIDTIPNATFSGTKIPSKFLISPSVTKIANNAFQDSALPIDFIIPTTVANIEPYAFAGATIPIGYHWEKDGQIVSAVTDGGHEYKVVAD